MGNGICHIGDVDKEEMKKHGSLKEIEGQLDLPNSYAKSPSKPFIETYNPTISLNQEDCSDILLTSSLEMISYPNGQTSIKEFELQMKFKQYPQTNILQDIVKDKMGEFIKKSNPKPILILEKLKIKQNKKVRFDEKKEDEL